MAIAKTKPNPWNKVVSAIRRDPQKAGILTVLVAILVVLQLRLITHGKGGIAPASALAAATTDSSATVQPTYSAPSNQAAPLRAWVDQPAEGVHRNFFIANLDRFPSDGGKLSTPATSSSFWDELAKSMVNRADGKKERQILNENLSRQASQLRLQSTVMGAVPKAVINGELVGEGDVVATGAAGESRGVSFRVLKIEARRIIVEREGIKLEIQMK